MQSRTVNPIVLEETVTCTHCKTAGARAESDEGADRGRAPPPTQGGTRGSCATLTPQEPVEKRTKEQIVNVRVSESQEEIATAVQFTQKSRSCACPLRTLRRKS